MRRLTLSLTIFFLALGAGLLVTNRFAPWAADVAPVETADAIATAPNTETTEHQPEFKDFTIDEDGFGIRLKMSLVANGSAAVCESEKQLFPNGKSLILFKRGNRTFLREVNLNFKRRVRNDSYSFFPVEFTESKTSLFIISNTPEITPGDVQTLFVEPWNKVVPDDGAFHNSLGIGDKRRFDLNGTPYTLRLSDGPTNTSGPVGVFVLESAGKSQILWYGSDLNASELVGLRWVGDLDHDNKLDLLFTYHEQNGGGSVDVLLLSSYAKTGNLVGPAAFSFARGCRPVS